MADKQYSLLENRVRETPGIELDEGQISSLSQFVRTHPHGDSILHSILNPQETFTCSFTVNQSPGNDFHNSTSTTGGLVNLWVYIHVDIQAKDVKRTFSGNAGGFTPGIPGGALM